MTFNWEHPRWQGQQGADLFEKLCADLLRSLGFKNVDWREGHPDEGWDIEAECEVVHPVGSRTETWYVQCKRYALDSGVPPTKIDTKRIEMLSKKPDCLLVITNSHFLPKLKDWAKSSHSFRVELWEGEILNELIPRFAPLVEQYFPELALELKDDFVSLLVHELRSSLQWLYSQISYTEYLAMEIIDPDEHHVQESFQRLREVSQNIVRHVERFNLISRTDFGPITGDKKRVNIAALIRRCVDSFIILGQRANVHIKLEVPRSLPIEADERSLQIMFYDLLDNALKYAHSNTEVVVKCSHDAIANHIIIEIVNIGVGIARDEISKVFQKYYRGSNRDARLYVSGLGIGLTLCKRIIEEQGGSISLESTKVKQRFDHHDKPWKTRCIVCLPILKGL